MESGGVTLGPRVLTSVLPKDKQTQSSTWTPEQLWGIDVGACDRRIRRWTLTQCLHVHEVEHMIQQFGKGWGV